MSAEVYIDYLLFSRKSEGGRNYLYFVEFATLRDELPHIERFAADDRLCSTLQLGDLCGLRATPRHRLLSAEPCDAYDLDDSIYFLLLRLRDAAYPEPGQDRFREEDYYSFTELRALLNYSESPGKRLANSLLRAACYLPALIVPPVLYILLLCWMLPSARGLWAPIVAVLFLPAMILSMGVIYQLISIALVRWERTRYGILRRFTLIHGGMRQSLSLSLDATRAVKKFFFGALSCMGAGLLIFLASVLFG